MIPCLIFAVGVGTVCGILIYRKGQEIYPEKSDKYYGIVFGFGIAVGAGLIYIGVTGIINETVNNYEINLNAIKEIPLWWLW